MIESEPHRYQLADNSHLQRTIYLEKPAEVDKKTEFRIVYEFTQHGVYVNVDPSTVIPVSSTAALNPYLRQKPPHIVFTDSLKSLSARIVGNEKNPYLIAKRLYEWVDTQIPWASAREYSTIRNISAYAYENSHGDCGIRALLFITLLRMNGIPARWQSGWKFQPPKHNMHDWGMIYFEPYGWMPMDVDYGLRITDDSDLKWFYLTGMDSYRLIFNDAYSQPLSPAKQHFRSETVDSQRGEVEWKGGNLYFDKWDWNMHYTVLESQNKTVP
jgi:transglutaminase-like putative cysteine protease